MFKFGLIFVLFIPIIIHADTKLRVSSLANTYIHNESSIYSDECKAIDNPQEYNNCLSGISNESDKKLNRIYNSLRSKMDVDDKKLLTQAQKIWLEFRSKECDFFNPESKNFGSYYAEQSLICNIITTEKRTADLLQYIEWSGCGSCRW